MRVTMVGHSTLLIETLNTRVLTDPYFGKTLPVFRNITSPAMRADQLRDVDGVLISHHHFDHVDWSFVRSLPRESIVLQPLGMKSRMKPWESRRIGDIEVVAVPAKHLAITIGFVLKAQGQTLYFAGDTFVGAFMDEIRDRLHPDVAFMPVTTFRVPMTMGEKGAAEAACRLGVKRVVPIHLGIEPMMPFMRSTQSVDGFRTRLNETCGSSVEVISVKNGESIEL